MASFTMTKSLVAGTSFHQRSKIVKRAPIQRTTCKAAEQTETTTTPEKTETNNIEVNEPAASTTQKELIDPVDGSVAYGAALGDSDIVSKSLDVFKTGRASEIINGRAAMVGFTAAMANEFLSGDSMLNQVWKVREVVNGFGTREILMPQAGMFYLPATVLLVLVASLAPKFRGRKDNGLDVPAESFSIFNPNSEMINGRAAMMGLVALFAVETLSGSAFF